MRKTPPSTIPLDYDYQLRMSPSSSTAANFYDNQTTSLFGDPVPPPPEEFLESLDSNLYGSLRRSSIVRDFPKANSFAPVGSDVTSSMQGPSDQGRLRSPAPLESRRIFPREPQTHSHLRPEIRILPGSDSSSDSRITPAIDVMDRKMDSRGPVEVDSDIMYYQEHHRWDTSSRISTEFGERFQDSGERKQHEPETRMRSIFSSVPVRYSRQISNESVSSSEWFKPTNNYQEWTRIPRLRPSSKNVISIKHSQQTHQDSSVAKLINDSNGSSSSEEKLPIEHEKMQDVSVKVRHKPNQKAQTDRLMSAEMKQLTGLPPAVPKRDVSPVILTNAITTGADYRVSPPRPHKKTSFTIIAEKSPQSSRAQSPHNIPGGRISPFFGRGFKEPPRPSSQPVPTAARLKLPAINSASNIITSDDSPRPSVQFNMSSFSGRGSPSKAQSKGILQNKPGRPFSRDEGGKPLAPNQKVRSFDALPRISGPDGGAIPRPPSRRLNKSALDLYNVKKGEAPRSSINPNPTSRQRGLLRVISSADNSPSRIPVRTNLNASMDDLMLKRRSSLSPTRLDKAGALTPLDRRSSSQTEPRSSIVSLNSDRRSSNLSSVTTSDFSFRRPSNSSIQPTIGGRRQSIYQSTVSNAAKSRFGSVKKRPIVRKVAKPTTLSPIIGTPNREGPSSSEDVESINQNGKLGVGSKIPVREGINILSHPNSTVTSRANSRANSRTNSRAPSVINSRSNSPIKEHFLSQPSSRTNSRSPSRATSRPPSRQTSRPVSRSSSRQESRMQSRSNSRSNSRLSQRGISPPKGKSSSPPKNRRASPNKSRSPSPKKTRRKSLSPPKSLKAVEGNNKHRGRESTRDKPASRKGSPSKQANLKRNSPKRSNSRKDPVSAKKPSNDSKKTETSVRRTPLAAKKSISPKRQDSNLKRSTSNLKQEVLKREVSSIKKASSSPSLKREPSNVIKSTNGLKREQSSIKGGATSKAKKDLPTTKTGVTVKKGLPKRTASNLGKKLEKKDSFRKEKQTLGSSEANPGNDGNQLQMEVDSSGKLVALTKQSVVSMTTAAIAAQPAQITTAVTNQISLNKTNSSGQLINTENLGANLADMMSDEVKDILPAAILERSTKTLETIQKTVTEAHEEIQKTINENLTDLKTLESDIGKLGEDISKHNPFEKSDSIQTVIEIPTADRGEDHDGTVETSSKPPKSPVPPTQPIEADVSVVNAKASSDKLLHPNVNHNNNNNDSPSSSPGPFSESGKNLNPSEDMAERNYEEAGLEDSEDKPVYAAKDEHPMHMQSGEEVLGQAVEDSENNNDGGNKGSGSQEYLDEEKLTGCCGRSKCCRCCSKFCIPCRRCQCSKCCRKKTEMETAVIASEVDEKPSCWKRMKCCKKKKPPTPAPSIEENIHKQTMETISEEPETTRPESPKQNKCKLCLNKFFCCRATNKVEAVVTEAEEVKKCCFCIPCGRKKQEMPAWQERRESILSAPPPPGAKSSKLLEKLMCWKKPKPAIESRRTSMNSKKQSIAPTLPPEDTRPKLHVDLVEFNSKMKGAIPVMPLPLAWFCMICNCLVPGLGTIFSGFFCLCVGIPRFSQYDSAKARIGSLIINCIVGVAQAFCVIFCLVGWGWSIWWGTIMLKTARKLRKIRKVERLEMEEEQRQAAAARMAEKDVEAAKT